MTNISSVSQDGPMVQTILLFLSEGSNYSNSYLKSAFWGIRDFALLRSFSFSSYFFNNSELFYFKASNIVFTRSLVEPCSITNFLGGNNDNKRNIS